ncbi:MAG: tetratricopeptide repeat protein [Deltaproteobacteria bacterium]|nr:tetratricopeptide repeat protein [Deltaproteobacteria bacterium]
MNLLHINRHKAGILCFLVFFALAQSLFTGVLADSNGPKSDNAQTSGVTPPGDGASRTAGLSEIAFALSKDDFDTVIGLTPSILEKDKDRAPMLVPLLAYAYGKKGDKARAIELLKGRMDLNSTLARAQLTGERITPPGMKEGVSGVEMFFTNISVQASGAINKAVYKKALMQALRKAFLKRAVGAEKKDIEAFEEKILPHAKKYYLSHYALTSKEVENYYSYGVVVFIDAGQLNRDMGYFTPKSQRELRIKLLLGKRGAEFVRKSLLKDLLDLGFSVEDIGEGEYGADVGSRTKGSIVIQVTEIPAVAGSVMGSNFKSIEGKIDLTILNGNNGLVITKLSKTNAVVHLNEEEGKEIAIRKAYEKLLSPLKDTLTHIELTMGKEIASGALPPIEMHVTSAKDVFSNIYKFYAEEPILLLSIRNNSEEAYRKLKVSLAIKGYMDYPTEVALESLGAREEKILPLKAVFNNSILDLTENTLLQSEVDLSYSEDGAEKVIKMRHPIQVYEKHALVWDDKGKLASFFTVKDPVVMGFATKAVREYNYPEMNQAIVKARALFGAMGALGLTYVPDPTPYSMVSNVTNVVDYVQFPRETLSRKAGDCDDLVSLLGASLKSLGIGVIPLEAPGHLFMMFDTGIPEENEIEFGFQRDMYVIYEGTVWIPFEATLVGSSFTLAWEKGYENFVKWKGQTRFVDLTKVWNTYAQPTLAPAEFKQELSKSDIEKKFPDELEALKRKQAAFLPELFKGNGVSGLKQMLVIYGKTGMLEEALKIAAELQGKAGDDPNVLNNVGNIYFLKGDYEKAVASYNSALKRSNDPGILVNIARAYLRMGERALAEDFFRKALGMDEQIKYKYLKLYTDIGL